MLCLGSEGRQGALTAVGAVSPPGGDLSEPVTQATLRIVKVFWGLDANLAYRRHFPAINWLLSYSLYLDRLDDYFAKAAGDTWRELRVSAMRILQEESELEEIVRLVGVDALSSKDRLTMETARSIREDFLHQNAFDEVDTYSSLPKQHLMLGIVLAFDAMARKYLEQEKPLEEILALPVREEIARAKYVRENDLDKLRKLLAKLSEGSQAAVVG